MSDSKISNEKVVRRSGNYMPSIWTDDYVQSLTSIYLEEIYLQQAEKQKQEVRKMLEETKHPMDQLELVDVLQRIGISYHFENEIDRILESIYGSSCNSYCKQKNEGLYAAALQFRLLRQHGHQVTQEVFSNFLDDSGNFKTCLCEDVKGLLCLYEASYLSMEGESILDMARDFTTRELKENLKKNDIDENLVMQVSHALELPLHWRISRLEARWFIDVYKRRQNMNLIVLQFAKLDFNMVQAMYQDELKQISTWYRNSQLAEKMSFARDRLVENFLWATGFTPEPQFRYCRRMLTKLGTLLTSMDDIYDVYGTLDELKLFTDVVERWDINSMEQLPDYMQICFLVLFNSINELAYDVLKEQGLNIVPYLRKTWGNLCKAYLVDAKWYYSGYTPTLSEYLDNALISITCPLLLIHAYFCNINPITKEALDSIEQNPDIVRWPSVILRLADDLGTSTDEMKKGDNPKSIQCYMNDTGALEEDAREYIRGLIGETWKKLNKAGLVDCPFPRDFIRSAMNVVRIAHYIYQFGDGYGTPNYETKDHIISLVVEPIPLP